MALQLLVVLGGLELILRLLRPHHRGLGALLYRATAETDFSAIDSLPDLLEKTPHGYRPREVDYGYVLNSRSFRSKEYETEKSPGTYRVVLLGDSFTYGVVPDAVHWSTRLEAGLAAGSGNEIEVLRLGVPGTGTPFQLRLWQIEARELEPDLVILGFFVGNDFQDELGNSAGWQGQSDRLALVSYTYRAFRNVLRLGRSDFRSDAMVETGDDPVRGTRATGGYELAEFGQLYREDRPTIAADLYRAIAAQRMEICLREKRWRFDLRFRRVVTLLKQLDAEVTANGSRLVVLLIPDEFQIDHGVREEAMAFAGKKPEDYEIDLPQEQLTLHLEGNGIEYVNLLSIFREKSRAERLYLPRDTHWNRAGNRLAAEALLEYLSRFPPLSGPER